VAKYSLNGISSNVDPTVAEQLLGSFANVDFRSGESKTALAYRQCFDEHELHLALFLPCI
jgi:hypothetical protein